MWCIMLNLSVVRQSNVCGALVLNWNLWILVQSLEVIIDQKYYKFIMEM